MCVCVRVLQKQSILGLGYGPSNKFLLGTRAECNMPSHTKWLACNQASVGGGANALA